MGMTIDEADTILSCERLDSSMGCGASDEDIDEALGVAIETMRKYQKIEQILKSIPYGGDATVRRIQKVVVDKVESEDKKCR